LQQILISFSYSLLIVFRKIITDIRVADYRQHSPSPSKRMPGPPWADAGILMDMEGPLGYNSLKMKILSLGYSPCPNDTFIFYALVHGRLDTGGLGFSEILKDVEALNRMALGEELDITKVSCHAFGNLREGYCLLRSGGALGRGCGPLVVAREECDMKDLRGKRIAIPGRLTTAFLLLQLHDPALGDNVAEMPFYRIMEAVQKGEADAGLIIHEGRFTYPRYGLVSIKDLGQWWEETTGLPIPLGSIIARRGLGRDIIQSVDALVKESVLYAMENRQEPEGYIKEHSQELEDSVIRQHIDLYVNDYTVDMGEDGIAAMRELLGRAEGSGIIKGSSRPLFVG
jgi:1,4-dihydroxy-6-naphthoate synthase